VIKRFLHSITWFDFIFFSFLAFVLLAFNNYISLWDQDEAAYAGFAKRMLETGDYVIPDFTWSEIHRKPPLHFWLIALAYKLFGLNHFAVRFFVALSVWLSVFFVRVKGKRFLGYDGAVLAAMFMAGNVFLVMLGKMAVTDALLLFFYTVAGISLLEYFIDNNAKALVSFYLAFATGMLVKGPPMLLWAGFLWLLLLVFYPEKRKVIRTHPWIRGILALIPFAAWLYVAYRQNPEFVKWWTDWYILKRTHSAVLGQTGPPGTYFLLFFVFGLAYLPLVWTVFAFIFKFRKNNDRLLRILILWFIAGWLPYEFLPSKLPAYVLAAYPAMAMLLALAVKSMEQHKFNPGFRLPLIIQTLVFLLLTFGLAAIWIVKPVFLPAGAVRPLLLLVLLTFTISVLSFTALKSLRKNGINRVIFQLLISGIIWTAGLFTLVLPSAEYLKNATYRTAKTIAQFHRQPEAIVVLNHFAHPPSLIFYLEKFHPQSEIVIPDPEKYLKNGFSFDNKKVYILSEKQWEVLKNKEISRKVKAVPVRGVSTGSVGKNDYVIIFSDD
jgi:4-amino-4-deoxy-L-arabinose transferase-like glycosyltransferase